MTGLVFLLQILCFMLVLSVIRHIVLRKVIAISPKPLLWISNAALVLAALVLLTWFHAYRWPSDYAIESELSSALTAENPWALKKILEDSDTVCFLLPYDASESLEYLSREDREYLDRRVQGLIGTDPTVWWLIGLKGGSINRLYRMSTRIKPAPKKERCAALDKLTIRYVDRNRGVVFDAETKDKK